MTWRIIIYGMFGSMASLLWMRLAIEANMQTQGHAEKIALFCAVW